MNLTLAYAMDTKGITKALLIAEELSGFYPDVWAGTMGVAC